MSARCITSANGKDSLLFASLSKVLSIQRAEQVYYHYLAYVNEFDYLPKDSNGEPQFGALIRALKMDQPTTVTRKHFSQFSPAAQEQVQLFISRWKKDNAVIGFKYGVSWGISMDYTMYNRIAKHYGEKGGFEQYTLLKIRFDRGLNQLVIQEQLPPEVLLSRDDNPTDTINIYSGDKNGYEGLSNLLHGPVKIGETTFPTVEHAYQYTKADMLGDTVVAQQILEAKTGFDAQKLGRTARTEAGGLTIEQWDTKSYDILKDIMTKTFVQNKASQELLLKTGNATLVHKSTTGASLGKWEQQFPAILTDIRRQIKASRFTNHSGGAEGSDITWDTIGRSFGVTAHRHYYTGVKGPKNAPHGNQDISNTAVEDEGRTKAAEAAADNWGYTYSTMKDERLIRNWAQVKFSDAVFAIGTIVKAGERIFPDQPGDTRLAIREAVTGGTGYAVGMAIRAGKPVHVFDQTRNGWYTWDGSKFVKEDTPILTPNFAGIGTRNPNDAGRKAIEDIYRKTLEAGPAPTAAEQPKASTTPGTQILTTPTGKVYKGHVTTLAENQIFVFGANDRGIHGAGTAGLAMWGRNSDGTPTQRGEQWILEKTQPGDQGMWAVIGEHSKISKGVLGHSYGLVTVEGKLGGKSEKSRISVDNLRANIAKLYETAMAHPDRQFLVAYTNNADGRKNLNGYSPLELATIFDSIPIPENVIFEEGFNALMQSTTRRRIASGEYIFEEQNTRESRKIQEELLDAQQRMQTAPILNEDGTETGQFFSAEQMVSIEGMFKRKFSDYLIKNGDITKVKYSMLDDLVRRHEQVQEYINRNHPSIELAGGLEAVTQRNKNLKMIIDSYEVLYTKVRETIYAYYHIDLKNLNNQRGQLTLTKDAVQYDENGNIIESESDIVNSEHTQREDVFGKMSEMIDPNDTMTGRLKLWLSTIPVMEYGPENPPTMRKVSIGNPGLRKIIVNSTQPIRITRSYEQASKEVKVTNETKGTFATTISYEENGTTYSKLMRLTAVGKMTAEEAETYNNSRLGQMQQNSKGDIIPAMEGDVIYELVPFVQNNHVLKTRIGWTGGEEVVDVNKLFEKVLEVAHDVRPDINSMVSALREAGETDATLASLADKLSKANQMYQNEFLSVVRKQNQKFQLVYLKYSTRRDGSPVLEARTMDSNRGSAKQLLIDSWKQMQKTVPGENAMVYKNSANQFQVSSKVAAQFAQEMKELVASYDASDKNDPAVMALMNTQAKEFIQRLLASNGILFSDEMAQDLIDSIHTFTSTRIYGATVFDHMRFTPDGKAKGLFSIMVNTLTGTTETDRENYSEEEDAEVHKRNFLYTDKDITDVLTAIHLRHNDSVATQSFRNVNGDVVYSYGHPTYLSDEFDKLKNDQAYKEQLASMPFSSNSFLLKQFTPESPLTLQYVDGFNLWGKNAGTERTAMSPREQEIDAVSRGLRTGSYGDFYSLTHSDKTRTPLFSNVLRMQQMRTEATVLEGKLVDDLGTNPVIQIASVFISEFNRIRNGYLKQGTYGHEKYELGNKFFYLTPFNQKDLAALVDKGVITAEDYAIFYNGEGAHTDIFKSTTDNRALMQPAVMKVAKHFANELVDLQIAYWKRVGFIQEFVVRGNQVIQRPLLNETYIKEAVAEAGLVAVMDDRRNLVGYAIGEQTLSIQEVNDWVIRKAATEFGLNSYFVNIGATQALFGDPAQFFKGNIEATLVEYQKRLAGPIAPHRSSAIGEEESYRAITIADVNIGLPSVDNPAYKKGVNIADAQEWVTMKEVLYNMLQEGQLSREEYVAGLAAIEANPDNYSFDKALEDKIFGVTKPVYYGNTAPVNGDIMFKQYIKSSALPLYPPLYAGKELDKLRKWMEKNNIARAHMVSAKKAGNGSAIKVINDDGTVNVDSLDPVRDTVEYNRRNLGIQQDNPYNKDKKAIAIVSQENKLITSTLSEGSIFTASNGNERDGNAIRNYREDLRMEMLSRKMHKFEERLGIEDGTITDPKKAYQTLIDMAKDDGMFPDELMMIKPDKFGNPLIHPFFSHSAKKFESLILSALRKSIQVKITGKSYVQASAAGINSIKEAGDVDQSRVIWVDGPRDLSFMTKKDGKVEAAEVLVPFNFFAKEKLDIKKFLKEDGTLDTEKIPVELLRMIGARIPNQGHNSMLPIKIVGFLPEEMADVIVVPNGITAQMGSDFDVDKLYVYQRPYLYEDGKLSAAVAPKDASISSMTDEQLMHEYFDIHWSILTHPDMYASVTNPLDKPDLANESKKYGQIERAPFFSPVRQNSDFLLQVDAKALVGLSSLATTFNAVIQNKDLKLGYINEKSEQVENPIIVHDENGNEMKLLGLSGNANSYYEGQSRTKHDNITTMQSAFLDNAKDPHAGKLNINLNTWPAAYAMVQLQTLHPTDGEIGQLDRALDLRYVTRLMTQDIVRQYSNQLVISTDNLSEYSQNSEDEVIEALESALLEKLKKSGMTETEINDAIKAIIFNPQSLDEMLGTAQGKQRNIEQLAILRKFDQFRRVGRKLIELTSLFNQDTQAAGASIVTALDKASKFDNIMKQDIILNTDSIMNYDGRETEQGYLFNSIIGNAVPSLSLLFPQANMRHLFNSIRLETGKDSISVKQQEEIVRSLRAFVFSDVKMDLFSGDIQAERVRLLFDTPQGPSLAMRLMRLQQTEFGRNNYLLQRLMPKITAASGDYVLYQATTSLSVDDVNNKRAWTDMLTNPDKEIRLLGEDLIRYAYITGGVQDNNAFVKFIPTAYLMSVGMPKYLANLHGKKNDLANSINANTFKAQYFQHFPERTVKLSNDFSEFGKKDPGAKFMLPINSTEKTQHLFVVEDGKSVPAEFIHARKYGKIVLYKRTLVTQDSVGYTQVDVLGTKKEMYEFNKNTLGISASVVPENRAGLIVPATIEGERTQIAPPPIEHALPDHFRAVGLVSKELTYDETIEVIGKMAHNENVPVLYQELANIVYNTAISNSPTELARGISYNNPYLSIGSYGERYAGTRMSTLNTNSIVSEMKINLDACKTTWRVCETLLHETIHELSVNLIYAYDDRGKHANRSHSWENMVKKYPHLQSVMQNYMNVYEEAKRHFDIDKEKLRGEMSPRDFGFLEYFMSNSREFITGLMTTPNMARWLNTIKTPENKSLWMKVVDAIKQIVATLGNALTDGKFDNESLLARALEACIPVMQYKDTHGQFIQETTHEVTINGTNYVIITDDKGNPYEVFQIVNGVARKVDDFEHVIAAWRGEKPPADPIDNTKDSKYEIRPGVFMNAEQRKAADTLGDAIANYSGTGLLEITLSGAAGTGKTTILKKILERVPTEEVVFIASSHNARIELQHALLGTNYPKVKTLASATRMIYDNAASDREGREVFKKNDSIPPQIKGYKYIVVDEVSMIDDLSIEELHNEVNGNCVIIYTGDHAQLAPVNQSKLAYPFANGLLTSTLVQNMRSEKADITGWVDQMRSFVEKDPNYYRELTGRVNSANVFFAVAPNEVIDSFISKFAETAYDKDGNLLDTPNHFGATIIGYTNNTRKYYNQQIRSRLFKTPIENLEPLVPGDYVRIDRVTYQLERNETRGLKGERELTPNERLFVRAVDNTPTEQLFTLEGDGGRKFAIQVPTYSVTLTRRVAPGVTEDVRTSPIVAEIVDEFLVHGRALYNNGKMEVQKSTNLIMRAIAKEYPNGVSYGAWLRIREAIASKNLRLEHAYAATSHNVQGSSFNHSFVLEDDFQRVAATYGAADPMRGMYVALSRARESLTILHPYNNRNAATATQNNMITSVLEAGEANRQADENPQMVQQSTDGEWTVVRDYLIAPDARDNREKFLDTKLAELKALRATLSAQITDTIGGNKKEERSAAKVRLQILDNQIETIQTQRTIQQALNAANEQLDWVERTLKKADLGPKDTMMAYKIVTTWATLSEVMEPLDDVDRRGVAESDIAAITARAATLRSTIVSSTFVKQLTGPDSRTKLTVSDLNNIEDENWFGSQVRSLDSASGQFAQSMGKLLGDTASTVDANTTRTARTLNTLDERMVAWGKKNGMTPQQVKDLFLRRTDKSLNVVNEFSNAWYTAITDIRKKRDKIVSGAIESATNKVIKESEKNMIIAKAYADYWNSMKTIGYTVDIRNLVDVTNGKVITGPNYDAEKARIEAAYGKDASDIIKQAIEKFERFLVEKEEFVTSVEVTYQTRRQEILAKGLPAADEAAEISDLETNFRNNTILQWDATNSPLTFLSSFSATTNSNGANRGDRYTVLIPNRVNAAHYYDNQYITIMDDPELSQMHAEIMNIIRKHREFLPYDVVKNLPPNFFPLIPSSMVRDGINIKENVVNFANDFVSELSASDQEIQMRKTENTDLRISYLHARKEELPTMSGDITRVLETFSRMANHFRHFSQVKEIYEIGEAILRETNRKRAEGMAPGKAIKNLTDAMEYAKQHLMYRQPKQLEGDLSLRVFDTNTNAWNIVKYTKAQLASHKRWNELTVEKSRLENARRDGSITEVEYLEQSKILNEKIDAMRAASRTVYASKVGDKLILINQAKAISYNPFSAIANWSFGLVSAANYAQGAKGLGAKADYDPKSWRKAFAMVTPAIRNFFADGDKTTAMKIYNLMELFGTMGDVVDSTYGETALASRRNKVHDALKPYAMMRSSDYNVRASVMIAMMLHKKIGVTDKATGERITVSLWDVFGNDGEFDTEKYVEDTAWSAEDVADRADWLKFKNRTKKIMYTVLGNTDKNSSKLVRKHVLGRMITQFRLSWLPESIASRFQDERYDQDLERMTKGRWREISDMGIGTYATILTRIALAKLGSESDVITPEMTMKDGTAIQDFNLENMYRNFSGMMWSLGIAMACLALKQLASGDDDEEKSASMMVLYNVMNRLYQDLFYFTSAEIMNNFTKSPIPAIQVVVDYQRAMKATYKYMTDENYELDEMALKWTKAGFPIAQASLINKVKLMSERDITTISR